jgi:hypothetical protein
MFYFYVKSISRQVEKSLALLISLGHYVHWHIISITWKLSGKTKAWRSNRETLIVYSSTAILIGQIRSSLQQISSHSWLIVLTEKYIIDKQTNKMPPELRRVPWRWKE